MIYNFTDETFKAKLRQFNFLSLLSMSAISKEFVIGDQHYFESSFLRTL